MANISLTRVNQKLMQVRALLDDVNINALTPVHLNSLKEAAAFHLVCAYQHYLREVAETYGLKNSASIRTELDLENSFKLAAKYPAEAQELMTLRNTSNSWLELLHRYYESLWSMPVIASEDQETRDSIIKVVDLDRGIDLDHIGVSTIISWQQEFIDLVRRQRETSAEF